MPKTKSKNPNLSKEENAPNNTNTSIGGNVTDSVVVVGDGNQTTFQKIINIFRGESESIDSRNRRVMLNHVENFWVKGILEKSLHGVALLELGIKEDATAVNYPWGIKKASTNENLSTEKPMLEIFKEIGLGRSLLILGAPGSGKTTMLLELTRQLIEIARKDENEPIPVVFNLSSWTEKLSLADWLAEQLNTFYYVPKKTAQKLVTDNKMFLMLDGLDEVKVDLREKCVNAINEFKTEHGLTSLAICSRIEEYQAIQTKLSLAGAVSLQPLTSKQVDSYFDKFGKSLSSLKQILKKDSALKELAETPLILSIMVLAYKDVNIKEIPESKNSKEQRKHLFNTYINRMFERKTLSENKYFSKEKTLHYLSWLAYKMTQYNLITYQVEEMQPDWLNDYKNQHLYKRIIKLMSSLVGGLIGGLSGGLIASQMSWWINGAILGLFLGIIGWWVDGTIRIAERRGWSWDSAENWIFGGLIGGLLYELLSMWDVLSSYWLIGVLIGIPVGILIGVKLTEQLDKISMIDKIRWSWKAGRNLLIYGLTFGFVGALINRLLDFSVIGKQIGKWIGKRIGEIRMRQYHQDIADFYRSEDFLNFITGKYPEEINQAFIKLYELYANNHVLNIRLFEATIKKYEAQGSLYGLVFDYLFNHLLIITISVVLFVGFLLSLRSRDIEETTYSGQRLKQTLFNSVFVFILTGLLSGFIYILINEQDYELFFRALNISLIFGLLGGLHYGVFTLIQHFSLRYVFTKNEFLPKQLIPFLDYAVDLIFLRRVGGSYIFVHRLLMEHFAEMYIEKENK